MHLVLVGTSHHRAPVELREQLYVSAPENPELVRRLAGENGEAVALSTCNRTELYVVDEDPAVAQERAFAELATLGGLSESEIAPSLYTLTGELAQIAVPVLVLVGDEDEGCLEPALMLKRTIPTAGLTVLPRTGHTANLEEPDVFNRVVDTFLASVARGAWHSRDPRSRSASTTGMS